MQQAFLDADQINLKATKKHKKTFDRILNIQEEMRNAYDSLIPNIHIININILVELIIKHVRSKPDIFIQFYKNDDIVLERNFGPTAAIEPSPAEIEAMFNKLDESLDLGSGYIKLSNSINEALHKYHTKLLPKTGANPNPVKELNDLSKELYDFSKPEEEISDSDAIILGRRFALKIKQVFGSSNTIGIIDENLGSSEDVLVFFGKSFTAMKTEINAVINTAIKKVFTSIVAEVNTKYQNSIKTISVGYVVNFGHGMVISKEGTEEFGKFMNAPGFASSVYGVAKGAAKISGMTAQQAASIYKEKSGLISNTIELTKAFDSEFGILMSLAVTITFPEDWDINQSRGRGPEKGTKGDLVYRNKTTRSSKDKSEYIKFIIEALRKNVLTANPAAGTSSRSINDFFTDTIVSLLLGKKVVNEKTKVIRKRVTPIKTRSIDKSKIKLVVYAEPQVVGPTGTTSFPIAPRLRTTGGQFTSLVSIQNILNQNLHNQIQQNMGIGNRRDILNYRTGRFAESARVEKMSQSREGMITAFYSYMRNPYATFSFGGAQASPATRDPKLLISRSIREIGATMVGNRMRAVLV
jgi:hypothetical protein